MALQTFTAGQILTANQLLALQANQYNQTVNQQTANYVPVASDLGKRIEMFTASNTTITFNTGLFNSGDQIWVQNIGSGTCTLTSGTCNISATVSLAIPQYGGGFVYFVNASTAVYFPSAISPGASVTSYTPTFTNITVGNGSLAGIFAQVNKLVYGQVFFGLGSTSSVGNDGLISLPVTGRSNTIATAIGTYIASDASASTVYPGFLTMQSTTTAKILLQNTSGTYASGTGTTSGAPFTWANGDSMLFNFVYAAA
jgi:hypothetical protein